MIKKIFLMLFMLTCAVPVWAKTYHYRSFSAKGIINEFSCAIGPLKDSSRRVQWQRKIKDRVEDEEYVLDPNYATLSWAVKITGDNTEYKGERIGNKIVITGMFKGRSISKVINIDARPFYFNPKLGLMGFALSQENSLIFWGVRSDNLDFLKMKTVKKGIDIIEVNGQKMECYQIWWAPEGWAKFFSRNYWFRKYDGVYVKQQAEAGVIRELTGEE
ncbi:MAG: hypothetical protein HQL26_08795 [Candidatus Omnitrophica bacterium]|nr:hypothetical protein [Candidatus Omnitrophota bacterium]